MKGRGQNRSNAVMATRVEPDDSLDDFPTPPWAGRALLEKVSADLGWQLSNLSCLEPACNRGFLLRALDERFAHVDAADAFDYGLGFDVDDFLFPRQGDDYRFDCIITNPPFRLAQEFALRGMQQSRSLTALLCRTQFSEGSARFDELFRGRRPFAIWQFVERVVMVKGRCVRAGDPQLDAFGEPLRDDKGRVKRHTTATSYAWFLWGPDRAERTLYDWIPPCRLRLERPGDYDEPQPIERAIPCHASTKRQQQVTSNDFSTCTKSSTI